MLEKGERKITITFLTVEWLKPTLSIEWFCMHKNVHILYLNWINNCSNYCRDVEREWTAFLQKVVMIVEIRSNFCDFWSNNFLYLLSMTIRLNKLNLEMTAKKFKVQKSNLCNHDNDPPTIITQSHVKQFHSFLLCFYAIISQKKS